MYTPVHVGHVQQHFQPSRHLHLKLELQTKKIREKKNKNFHFFNSHKKQHSVSHTTKTFTLAFSLPHLATSVSSFRWLPASTTTAAPVPGEFHLQRRRVLITIINNFHYKTIDRSLTLRFGQRLSENLVECLMPRLTLPPIFLAAALLYNSCLRSPRSPAIYIVSR